MTTPASLSPREQLQVYQRLLALVLHQAQTTGECDFPPFVELVHRWDELWADEPTRESEPASSLPVQQQHSVALEGQLRVIREAVERLQSPTEPTTETDIQQDILSVARETRLLEHHCEQHLNASAPPSDDVQAALATLRYVRVYLLAKLSDRHFLSVRNLKADEPRVYAAHAARCFRYLTALQNAVNIVVEQLLRDLHRESETH